jgi:GTP-binding protein
LRIPVVVIVGRPNVGKSTFFNRAIGRRKAVVHDMPGVTRDSNYGLCHWGGRDFYLVDTGGWLPRADEGMEGLIRGQVEMTLERAEAVVFLVDSRTGMTDLDADIAAVLRRSDRPVTVIANKVDGSNDEPSASEFYSLGLGDPQPVSSLHGRLMGDALDRLIEALPEAAPSPPAGDIKIAVVGRPNVGKSSIVNAMIGEGRMIVHDTPGTTRDAVDTSFRYHGKTVTLVDTAGLRKRSKITADMEFFASLRTVNAINECDVALLLLDASEPITQQDIKVAAAVNDSGKGAVIVQNKWDLVAKDSKTSIRMERETRRRAPFLSYAPMAFVSALTGQRVGALAGLALEVAEAGRVKVSTADVNKCLESAVASHSPPVGKGGRVVKVYYGTQAGVSPPTFIVFVSDPKSLPASYERYLARRLRESFEFMGNPIRLRLRRST